MIVDASTWGASTIDKYDWTIAEKDIDRVRHNRPELLLENAGVKGLTGRGKPLVELELSQSGKLTAKILGCVSGVLNQDGAAWVSAAYKLEFLLQLDDIRTDYAQNSGDRPKELLSHNAAARLCKLAESGSASTWLLPKLHGVGEQCIWVERDHEIPWEKRELIKTYIQQLVDQSDTITDPRQLANLLITARLLDIDISIDASSLEADEPSLVNSYQLLLSMGPESEQQALQRWHQKAHILSVLKKLNLPLDDSRPATIAQAATILSWLQTRDGSVLNDLQEMIIAEIANHSGSYTKPHKNSNKIACEAVSLTEFLNFSFDLASHKSLRACNTVAFDNNWNSSDGILGAATALVECFRSALSSYLEEGNFDHIGCAKTVPASDYGARTREAEQKLCQLKEKASRDEAAMWASHQAADVLKAILGVEQQPSDGKAFLLAYAQDLLPPALQQVISHAGCQPLLSRLAFMVLAQRTPAHLCGVPIQLDDIFALGRLMGVDDTERFLQLAIKAAVSTPGLRGSPLSFQQGRNLIQVYDSFQNHKTDVITDAAGSGKTTTISFLAQLVELVRTSELSASSLPNIVWLSPYPVSLQGVKSQVLDSFSGEIRLPVVDPSNIFLVIDEAHLLGPRSRQDLLAGGVSFYAGDTEISSYIGLTATPNLASDYISVQNRLRTEQQQLLERYKNIYELRLGEHEARLEELYQSFLRRLYSEWSSCIEPTLEQLRIGFATGSNFEKQTLARFKAAFKGGIRELGAGEQHFNLLKGRAERYGNEGKEAFGTLLPQLQDVSAGFRFFVEYKSNKNIRDTNIPDTLSLLMQTQLAEISECEDAISECNKCLAEIHGLRDSYEHALESSSLDQRAHPLQGAIDWRQLDANIIGGEPEQVISEMLNEHIPNWQQGSTQIVLPHSRLEFDDAYRISQSLVGACSTATIIWHSQVASEIDNPKDWIVAKGIDEGITTDFCTKKQLEALTGPVVMLYDSTTMQGGDFGSASSDREDRQVQQLILDGFKLTRQTSSAPLSTADWTQCLSRRRNSTAASLNAVILSTDSRDERLQAAAEQQQLREIHFSIMSLESKLAAIASHHGCRDYLQALQQCEREIMAEALVSLREEQSRLMAID